MGVICHLTLSLVRLVLSDRRPWVVASWLWGLSMSSPLPKSNSKTDSLKKTLYWDITKLDTNRKELDYNWKKNSFQGKHEFSIPSPDNNEYPRLSGGRIWLFTSPYLSAVYVWMMVYILNKCNIYTTIL